MHADQAYVCVCVSVWVEIGGERESAGERVRLLCACAECPSVKKRPTTTTTIANASNFRQEQQRQQQHHQQQQETVLRLRQLL